MNRAMTGDERALILQSDGRVLHAAWYRHPPENAVIVPRDALPEGDVSQYRYEGGAFVYDPLPEPEPEPEEPTAQERIAALEQQNALLTECLLEMSEIVYG